MGMTADAGTPVTEATEATETNAPSAPESGPGVADVIQQARAQLESGTAPALPGAEPAEAPAPVDAGKPAAADSADPVAPEAEQQTDPAAEDIGLPEGFTVEADGRIRGPDGRFYSEDQVAEMVVAGEQPVDAEPKPQGIKVLLPGRQPDDGDEEYEVADQRLAERINQLRNGYIRGEKARQAMDEAAAIKREAEQIIAGLRHDPVNTILGNVPENVRADLVRHLLADEAVWTAVADDLMTWDSDEQERRASWAELKAKRYEIGQQARAQIAEYQAVQENARQVMEALEGLVSESMSEEQARAFYRYAQRDLIEYVNQNGINRLEPAEVPALLYRLGTLQPFGIELNGNGGPATNGGSFSPAAPQPGAAVAQSTAAPRTAAVPTVPAPQVTAEVGQRFKAALERRRAAAAVAPAGAGASPLRLQPPPGQTVEERIAWARQQRGLG